MFAMMFCECLCYLCCLIPSCVTDWMVCVRIPVYWYNANKESSVEFWPRVEPVSGLPWFVRAVAKLTACLSSVDSSPLKLQFSMSLPNVFVYLLPFDSSLHPFPVFPWEGSFRNLWSPCPVNLFTELSGLSHGCGDEAGSRCFANCKPLISDLQYVLSLTVWSSLWKQVNMSILKTVG